MKISDEDIAKFKEKPLETEVYYYDFDGKEVKYESASAVAKKYVREGTQSTRYYIKCNRSGQLLNKLSPYFNPNDGVAVKDGRSKYEYKEANKEVFTNYMKFLETKREIFLKQAERSVNG